MDSKKISLRELVWMCFSFISSVGFLSSLTMANSISDTNDGGQGLGINAVWIFAFEGFIVGLCALAFAKLSSIHSNKKNGGAYLYARTAFGRLTGYLVAGMQYALMPFIISVQVLMLMRGFFEPPYIPADSVLNIQGHLGAFHDLILDLIGVVVYTAFAIVIFFGMKLYKKLAMITGYLKWGSALILILAGVLLVIEHGTTNYSYWFNKDHSNLNVKNFLYMFTASFFYFTGFEQIITSTRNIQNPEKNIGKGLLISMGIVTTMYVTLSIIFFGAVSGSSAFSQNMNISTWSKFGQRWVLGAGALIMLFSQLALKAQVSMINTLVGGSMLQPLADEGFISDKYKDLNKDDVPVKAGKLNMVLAGITVLIWLIIPDIINGSLEANGKNPTPFNINMLTSVTSVITILIYLIVIFAVLKYRKILKLKIWEIAGFYLVLVTLAINFFYHYYNLINDLVQYFQKYAITTDVDTKSALLKGLLGSSIEIGFSFLIFIGLSLNYVYYYKPKYLLRLKRNPLIQKELDSHFVLFLNENDELTRGLNLKKEQFIAKK